MNDTPRTKTYIQLSFWIAATLVGVIAVLYAKLIALFQSKYFFYYNLHPYLVSICTPFLFMIATFWVIQIAPHAKGSGIPQVLEAIELEGNKKFTSYASGLVSIKTAIVKVISTLFGILGGASIGREGPTVQLSASIFAMISKITRRYTVHLDIRSYYIAGGAAGVAAAFNTPLAGITFALEEMAGDFFSKFKRSVMFSIIIAGVVAQFLVGDYLYFGHPDIPSLSFKIIPQAIFIGVFCGLLGGIFSRILSQITFDILPEHWALKSFICGIVCAAITLMFHGKTAGSGYEVVREMMDKPNGQLPLLFGFGKFVTTVLSYLSGMAGGIFSPCLSIGAGLGYILGKLSYFMNLKVCALIGMVAFFSGVVQAPLTAVMIVMEMTDEHSFILPFMLAAIIAQSVSKLLMPTPLYHYLAFKNKKIV